MARFLSTSGRLSRYLCIIIYTRQISKIIYENHVSQVLDNLRIMFCKVRILFLYLCGGFTLLYLQQISFNGRKTTERVRNTSSPVSGASKLNTTNKIVHPKYKESEDAFSLTQFRSLMQRRIQHIKDVCGKKLVQGKTLSSIASLGLPDYGKVKDSHSTNILVLDKEGIIWCPVPKAASTSWMHNLLHFRSVALI